MKSLEKWVVASLTFVLIATGPNGSVAGDEPAHTGDAIKFSPSLGTDRPLEFVRVKNVKLSSNGRWVGAVTGWSVQSVFYMWDAETGRRLLRVENDPPKHFTGNVDIDDSGRRIVTGGSFNFGYHFEMMRAYPVKPGSLADLWEANSGRLVRTFVLDDQLRGAHAGISRNGARVACADVSLNVKLWDAETGRQLASVAGAMPRDCQADIRGFSADVTRFVARLRRQTDGRTFIYLCDLSAKRTRTIEPLPGENSSYGLVAIGGDGREVAAYLGDSPERELAIYLGRSPGREVAAHLGDAPGRELAIFDFETGTLRARLRDPVPVRNGISYMSFSPDGSTTALGMEDGRLGLVDRWSGERVELRVSDGPVRAGAFLPARSRVRIVAERRFIVNATRGGGEWAGPMRIADYAVRFPSP